MKRTNVRTMLMLPNLFWILNRSNWFWAMSAINTKKAQAPRLAPTGKCSKEKKRRSSLLFSLGYLTPRGWALELDSKRCQKSNPQTFILSYFFINTTNPASIRCRICLSITVHDIDSACCRYDTSRNQVGVIIT
jgi:hypothetical protein